MQTIMIFETNKGTNSEKFVAILNLPIVIICTNRKNRRPIIISGCIITITMSYIKIKIVYYYILSL